MNIKMSWHCREDRLDRLTFIATNVGWGEPVVIEQKEDSRCILTDTGVVLVMALDEDFLITAYLATMDKATAIFRHVRGEGAQMPKVLRTAVRKNAKYKATEKNL